MPGIPVKLIEQYIQNGDRKLLAPYSAGEDGDVVMGRACSGRGTGPRIGVDR